MSVSQSVRRNITSWGSRWCSTADRGGTATAPSRRPPLAAGRAPPRTAAVAAVAADPAAVAVADAVEMVADAGISIKQIYECRPFSLRTQFSSA